MVSYFESCYPQFSKDLECYLYSMYVCTLYKSSNIEHRVLLHQNKYGLSGVDSSSINFILLTLKYKRTKCDVRSERKRRKENPFDI